MLWQTEHVELSFRVANRVRQASASSAGSAAGKKQPLEFSVQSPQVFQFIDKSSHGSSKIAMFLSYTSRPSRKFSRRRAPRNFDYRFSGT